MKLVLSFVLLALLVALPARATVIITPSLFGNSSQMPGSFDDFTFFGNPIQFPSTGPDISDNYESGVATQPTLLTDFVAHVGADAQYTYGAQNDGATNYNPAYGTINTPAAPGLPNGIVGPQKTGILYSTALSAPDLVRFTLGPSTSNFDFGDFDVYVMISNAPTSGLNDEDLLARIYDPTGAVALTPSITFSLADATTTTGTATFAEFHITGAVSGDILQLGATSGNLNSASYISGVSFKSNAVSEPSTKAMLLGGLVLIGLVFRRVRKLAASRA